MGWFKNITRAVSKPFSDVGRAIGDIDVGKGLVRAAGGKQNLAYAIAAVAVVATAGAAAYGLPALVGSGLLGSTAAGTAVAGGALGASTTYGAVVGGAVVGAGIGGAAGAATGSLSGNVGEGALTGAATGAASGAVAPLAAGAAGEGLSALGVDKVADPRLFSAGTGAATGAATGATRAAITGGDIGRAAALGGATGGITGALFPTEYDPDTGKAIKPDFGESVAKGATSALTSYGLQQALPGTFAQPTRGGTSVEPSSTMVGGASPYATSAGPSALAAGLRVGAPELPPEGASIPGEKKLEPQRPVWNVSSLRTMSEEAA